MYTLNLNWFRRKINLIFTFLIRNESNFFDNFTENNDLMSFSENTLEKFSFFSPNASNQDSTTLTNNVTTLADNFSTEVDDLVDLVDPSRSLRNQRLINESEEQVSLQNKS